MKNKFFLLVISQVILMCVSCLYASATGLQTYNGETVREIYSLDFNNKSYQKITDKTDETRLLSLLKDVDSFPDPETVKVGFLIITNKTKHSIYLPEQSYDKNVQNLIDFSNRSNTKYVRHPQWLTYMSESNIDTIFFNGHHKKDGNRLAATVTNEKSINKISTFLKSIIVDPSPTICSITAPEPLSPKDEGNIDYHLIIQFKNGIRYDCYGDQLTIRSSDQKYRITYSLPSSVIQDLWEMFDALDKSEKISTVALVYSYTAHVPPVDKGIMSDDIELVAKVDQLLQTIIPCGLLPMTAGGISVYLHGTDYFVFDGGAAAKFGGELQFFKDPENIYEDFEKILDQDIGQYKSDALIISETKDDSSSITKLIYDSEIQRGFETLFASIKEGKRSPVDIYEPVESFTHFYSGKNGFSDCVLIEYDSKRPAFDFSKSGIYSLNLGKSSYDLLFVLNDNYYAEFNNLLLLAGITDSQQSSK